MAGLLATPAVALDVDGHGTKGAVDLTAREAWEAEQAAARVDPAVRLEEYERRPECDPDLPQRPGEVCFPGTAAEIGARICEGQTPIEPLWRRERLTPATPWTAWENIVAWTCPQTYLTLTAADFARLPLDPPPLLIQPDRTEHLVNMPTIMWTQPTQQLLTTTYTGRYRLAGTTTWATVNGTATTTTTTPPITVIEAPTHLVIGDCHTHPHDC